MRTLLLAVALMALLIPGPATATVPTPGASVVPGASPRTLADGRERLLVLGFGPPGSVPSGVPRHGARQRHGSCAWIGGLVRDGTSGDSTVPRAGFTEGNDATFVIAVAGGTGPFHVDLFLGAPDRESGPVDVLTGARGPDERLVAEGLVVPAGAPRRLSFDLAPDAGRLTIRLRTPGCRPWAVTGIDVHAPPGARLAPLAEPLADRRPPVPPPDDLARLDRAGTLRLLRELCDFLLDERLSDGGFSHFGAWYQNAYPIRALLAGGALLDDRDFTEAALARLDSFVAAQRSDGGWYSNYFGNAGCGGGETYADTASANLADLGSMSLCLALAAPHADSARAARYIVAARRYADRVVLPEQLPDGAFPNRRWMGRDHLHPYSVATATQASSLAALGLVTGDSRYLAAASRAGRWLASTVNADGTIAFRPHDDDRKRLLPAQDFGDAFYLAEALTWIMAAAADLRSDLGIEAASAAHDALDRYLWGTRGLAASAEQGYWWKPRSMWTSGKMAAVPYLLARARAAGQNERRDRSEELATWSERAVAWLGDPGLSRRIGVRAPYESLTGEYGLVTTGFAAIGVAEFLEPGVLFPGRATATSRIGPLPQSPTSKGPR